MKHAGSAALDRLEPLLVELRAFGNLKERSRGVFYHNGRAFAHFHEDPAGFFADLREGDDFTRYRVNEAGERRRFLAALRKVVQTV